MAPHRGAVEPELLIEPDEQALAEALRGAAETSRLLRAERFAEAMLRLAALRAAFSMHSSPPSL